LASRSAASWNFTENRRTESRSLVGVLFASAGSPRLQKLNIGVLELLADSASQNWGTRYYGSKFKRHYASIMPQAVAVWCRQLGHHVTYATYYGQADPRSLLPDQLDVVFLSTYTQASATAYALAKLFRRDRTLTVLGGPHARSFPTDSLRFFDLVVQECDKPLVDEILRGAFAPGTTITSGRTLTEIPSVEERLPDLRRASLTEGRRPLAANVALLTSVGCPYTCGFCVDWNNPYAAVPRERLEEDLRFVSKELPGVFVSYHDPNFGVQFDQTLDAIESVAPGARNPYIMESSLSIMKGPRLRRLKESNCFYVAPGIESWDDYSNKAGVGAQKGWEKVARVVAHFQEIHEYVPNLQANFIFGSDVDRGDEPVRMTQEFIRQVPYVWPTINIPVPFGRTPLYDSYRADGRILTALPFSFYYMPHLVTTLKHYEPIDYYGKLIQIYSSANSLGHLRRRLSSTPDNALRVLYVLRTLALQATLSKLRRAQERLQQDQEFRAYHDGKTHKLPTYYRALYASKLGRYAELISEAESTPEMEPPLATAAHGKPESVHVADLGIVGERPAPTPEIRPATPPSLVQPVLQE